MKSLLFVVALSLSFAQCVSAHTRGDRTVFSYGADDCDKARGPVVTATLLAADWHRPKEVSGKSYGFSGMAKLPDKDGMAEFLVVHDDDSDRGPRLGILTVVQPGRVTYRRLNWLPEDRLSLDLEAISAVPGKPGQFLVLSHEGRVFLLKVSGENATVLREFVLSPLPPAVQLEGLSVQSLDGQLVIAWGHRGGGKRWGEKQPGLLYYGLLDLEGKEGEVVTGASQRPADIEVNYPSKCDPNTRHIADLRIDAGGVVWASATNDPCDSCKFTSGVYRIGVLSVSKKSGTPEVHFELEIDERPRWTADKKLEAIELVPGTDTGFAFGSEDENDGGWLYFKRAQAARH